MQRVAVKSSLVAAIAYDAEKQICEVEFHGKKEGEPGRVYRYMNFTAEAWEAWSKAESIGKHFLSQIKGKKNEDGTLAYPCVRIEENNGKEAQAAKT